MRLSLGLLVQADDVGTTRPLARPARVPRSTLAGAESRSRGPLGEFGEMLRAPEEETPDALAQRVRVGSEVAGMRSEVSGFVP